MFDCVVSEVRERVRQLRPELLSSADATKLVDQLTTLRKLVDGALVLVAARAADGGSWKATAARSPEEWLARKAGTSVGEAHELVATSSRIERLPATAAAVRSGSLSLAQAAAVADGATTDRASETDLLHRARHDSLRNLRAARDEVKAAARTDDAARREHWRATRGVFVGRDADGAGIGRWRLPPELHAEVVAALRPFADAAFDAARRTGEREAPTAYLADGLVAMARTASGTDVVADGAEPAPRPDRRPAARPVPTIGKLVARIDHTALVRGHTVAGETCDIPGVGPVPVSVVQELVATGDVFLTAVVTRGVDVVTVAHLGRRPNAAQLTALQWRDPVCRIEGCGRAVRQWDHHEDWAATHVTRVPALGGLCGFHHDQKTHHNRHLVDGALPGKLRLVEPARTRDGELAGHDPP